MEVIIFSTLFGILLFERVFPRTKLKFIKQGLWEDLFYFTLMFLIGYFGLDRINNILGVVGEYSLFKPTFSHPVLEYGLCLFYYDFLRFILHLSMHKFSFMWNLHKLHHTTTELSVTSAYRNSYFEDFALLVAAIPFVYVINFRPEVVTHIGVFFTLHGFLLHSNINVRFRGPFSLMAGPYFHASHHIKEKEFNYANYGATFTFWDKLFGTFYLPDNLTFENVGLYDRSNDQYYLNSNFIVKFFCLDKLLSKLPINKTK